MRSLIIPAFLILLSCSTPRGLDPSRLPAEIDMELEQELSFDFNHDGIEDVVKLHPAADKCDYSELVISLSNKKSFDIISNKYLVYAHSNPGASLELLENGSFKIMIDHSGAGRSASLREYTVSFRHGKFVLSGITISEYDRVDPELGGSCDINLLTGDGERNSKPVKLNIVKKDITAVNYAWLPKECKF
jgi:hypothetical protein